MYRHEERALGAVADATRSERTRVVVLASGSGTLLAALLSACERTGYPVAVVAVGSDRLCPALDRARRAGVDTVVVPGADHGSRAEWDAALAARVAEHEPDLVVCAGFMRLLGPAFLARHGGRILNTHPALLPAFPGAHAVRDAIEYGVKVTGATVNLVDAGVDTGPILAQRAVDVHDDDDEASLHERIKVVERQLLVDVVAAVATRGWTTDGRKVHIS